MKSEDDYETMDKIRKINCKGNRYFVQIPSGWLYERINPETEGIRWSFNVRNMDMVARIVDLSKESKVTLNPDEIFIQPEKQEVQQDNTNKEQQK
jgi:hypothetical protein